VATFSSLSIDKAGTGYTLAAAVGAAGGRDVVGVQHQPGGGEPAGFQRPAEQNADPRARASRRRRRVTVQDAFGNNGDQLRRQAITVAIGHQPGGGDTVGTDDGDGVGRRWRRSPTCPSTSRAAGYTLTAASGALTGATSAGFNINPAAATRLAFTVQPTSTTAGAAISPAVQVTVQDAFGTR